MKASTPVSQLSFVGPKIENSLNKIGIETLRDLLFYFPKRYEDLSNPIQISQAKLDEKNIFKAKVLSIKSRRTPKRKMFITEAIIEDGSGALSITWFNQPYITKQLKKGVSANFIGTVKKSSGKFVLTSPQFELLDTSFSKDKIHSGRIVPIYRESSQISSRMLRLLIWTNLKKIKQIDDFLPTYIKKNCGLIELEKALTQIHFPINWAILKKAKRRLAFDELFIIRTLLQKKALERINSTKAYSIAFDENSVKSLVEGLTFSLTTDQRKAAWQIIRDLEKPYPMERLLEGDVGSGKTIVAAIAGLSAVNAGFQVAIMAPTEVLARQHFNQLLKDLKNFDVEIALLVSGETRLSESYQKDSQKVTRPTILNGLESGSIKLIIGTHALIQKDIKFKNLAFVVIDEQHRFGVKQRAMLLSCAGYSKIDDNPNKKISRNFEKKQPHFLTMSATPIPRTLSLVFYGDLKISRIKKLPSGRKKILTQIIIPKERNKIYKFIEKEVLSGRQAFIICPLIDESEKIQTKAVQKEFELLSKKIFPTLKLGLLHGRMKSSEKKETMRQFEEKELNILVATPVIEVGIDIPNATVMMIEGSERFGLAQLHQLRGRVGRGKHQSYCFLFTELPSKDTISRLRSLTRLNSGFELAEKDLENRGPGDFIGDRQSGLPDLVMASLSDIELITLAKNQAKTLLKNDPELNRYPLLKKKIELLEKKVHLE